MQNDFNEAIEQIEQIIPIEDLQMHGINMNDIMRLKQSGFCTVKSIYMATNRNLCKIKGISELKVEKLKEIAGKILGMNFMTANEAAIQRKQVFKITTGSTEFDRILGGGVQSMSITELFGEFRTGKTQICSTLCITTQLDKESGGMSGKVAFIDTEGTFRPERLREIAMRYDLEPDVVLENVLVARAYNSDHQMDLLSSLAAKFTEDKSFRMLIVDSVIALFRTDFIGRGELSERQQKLNLFLQRLLRISEEFNIAVVITNQMMSDPGATMSFVSDPKKPIGGHIMAHASTTRIYLRKGRDELRIAKIYDSPDMPETEATYSITTGGINDGKD